MVSAVVNSQQRGSCRCSRRVRQVAPGAQDARTVPLLLGVSGSEPQFTGYGLSIYGEAARKLNLLFAGLGYVALGGLLLADDSRRGSAKQGQIYLQGE